MPASVLCRVCIAYTVKPGFRDVYKRQVRKELEELKSGFVGEQELEKVKNKFESTQIFGNINYLNVATNLA